MIHDDTLPGRLITTPHATRPHAAIRRGSFDTAGPSRPGLIRLHGTCECGTGVGRANRRLMTDHRGQMWLADTDDPSAGRIPLPDFATDPTRGLEAGAGPQLWDALVLALAHQDLPAPQALEQVQAWAAFGPMSFRDDTGTVHALPSAESVLTAIGIASDGTRCLEVLRTAAAAHQERGDAWQRLCGRHLTEALERVEGVTAASARAAAACHGLHPDARAGRQTAAPRPELSRVRIAVVGPGSAAFVSSASEVRPNRIPGAFTWGRRTLAHRQVHLYSGPDERHRQVRFTDAREMILAHADGLVVLVDPHRPDLTRPVMEKARQSGRPFVVAFTGTGSSLRNPVTDAQPMLLERQDDTAALGVLRVNPHLAASAHDVLQFLAHHIRTPSKTTHSDPAVPLGSPASGPERSATGAHLEAPP